MFAVDARTNTVIVGGRSELLHFVYTYIHYIRMCVYFYIRLHYITIVYCNLHCINKHACIPMYMKWDLIAQYQCKGYDII